MPMICGVPWRAFIQIGIAVGSPSARIALTTKAAPTERTTQIMPGSVKSADPQSDRIVEIDLGCLFSANAKCNSCPQILQSELWRRT